MKPVIIRKATATDAAVLLQIRNDAHAKKIAHGDEVWGKEGDGFSEKWILDHLNRKDVYIAELGGIPVATVTLGLSDEERWGTQEMAAVYVHGLCVRANYNGLGLGASILDWCAREAMRLGRTLVRLDCAYANRKLCGYYESLGFFHVGLDSKISVWSLYEKSCTVVENGRIVK